MSLRTPTPPYRLTAERSLAEVAYRESEFGRVFAAGCKAVNNWRWRLSCYHCLYVVYMEPILN